MKAAGGNTRSQPPTHPSHLKPGLKVKERFLHLRQCIQQRRSAQSSRPICPLHCGSCLSLRRALAASGSSPAPLPEQLHEGRPKERLEPSGEHEAPYRTHQVHLQTQQAVLCSLVYWWTPSSQARRIRAAEGRRDLGSAGCAGSGAGGPTVCPAGSSRGTSCSDRAASSSACLLSMPGTSRCLKSERT
jgi:hypothetical protein